MKPKDVKKKHEKVILARLNKNTKKAKAPKFRVNDKVRISKHKGVFKKGYFPNWSNEVFTIYAIKPTKPITYILQDVSGEILRGGFYEQELIKAATGNVYLVDKVIRRKGSKALVRWRGFDKTHDSWVNSRDLLQPNK